MAESVVLKYTDQCELYTYSSLTCFNDQGYITPETSWRVPASGLPHLALILPQILFRDPRNVQGAVLKHEGFRDADLDNRAVEVPLMIEDVGKSVIVARQGKEANTRLCVIVIMGRGKPGAAVEDEITVEKHSGRNRLVEKDWNWWKQKVK